MTVFDSQGRVIASSDQAIARNPGVLLRTRQVQEARRGRAAISDVFLLHVADQKVPAIELAVPVPAKDGRRVLVYAAPVSAIQQFASGLLTGAAAVRGGDTYLVDSAGVILAGGRHAPMRDGRIADPTLRRDAVTDTSGTYDGRTFASVLVPLTRWRVVFAVPTGNLYAPANGNRRAAWAVFAALTVAVVALMALLVTALRGARRLAALRAREQAAQVLAHERLHDHLTGLPNRSLLQDRVEHAMASLPRSGTSLALLFVDLDRFKRINDSLGHERGDAVLREVARRLQSAMRPGDTVSRFGGDEFVALCVDLAHEDDALRIAHRLSELLEPPVQVDGRDVTIQASIGVAAFGPSDRPVDPADLIRDADVAMYRAKQRGRGRVEVFDAKLYREAVERLDAESALRQAVADDAFELHYQPIVRLPDRSVLGVEALVRWRREPDGPLVPPGEFIPLAEDTGLIVPIGEIVLRRAIAQTVDWGASGALPPDFTLFVNVSARQLADPGFADVVRDALTAWTLPPLALCLELTESAVAADPEAAQEMLSQLDAMGVRLAIDDFGAGHSSLGQLSRVLPISILKLDRSFVSSMSTSRDRGIVLAAAALARALNVTSVAEGVESQEQATELSEMGFALAQGYHFGRPVVAEELTALLASSTLS
jgi:diguanylate cyclase (GGDEF)-like protein